VEGPKLAYDAWAKLHDLAEILGVRALLVYDEDAEILAAYEPGEEGDPFDDEPDDIDSDEGFDPYEGCFTWDC
jgi:hypothetical protein